MQNISMLDAELLKYAVENSMIDTASVQKKIEMQKKEELIKKHTYKIWEGTDGKWHTYLPDKKKGRIPKKRNSKEALEKVVVDYWREEVENPTVKDVYTEWIYDKLKRREVSKATCDRYDDDFKRFFREFGQRRIKQIIESDIEDFLLNSISEFSLTAKAFSNLRTLVFGIFKRAKKKRYISFSITQLVSDIEISRKSFKKIVKEDYEEVFMECEEPKVLNYLEETPDILNLGILLMFKTGMRVGELVVIKTNDIAGNVIHVGNTETRYKDNSGKTVFEVKETPKTDAGIRNVIVPKDYMWIIKKMRLLNPFGEFLMMKNGTRVKTYSVRRRLYDVCEKTNIHKKSPHKIRKTYGTILMDGNVDSMLIIGQMGHTDIQCTEKHYHRNRKDNDMKTEILSKVPGLMAN